MQNEEKVYEVEMTTTVYHTIYVKAASAKKACKAANALIDSGDIDIESSSDICFTDSALFNVQAHEANSIHIDAANLYDAKEVLEDE